MWRTSFAVALMLAADARLLSQAPSQSVTPLGLDEYVRVPDSNPMSAAKVLLGRALFFDPVLSVDRSIACASCHRPSRAFSDTTRVSFGILGRETARNTPSILNRAYGESFFWDGRAATLEEAVLQPIANAGEMGLPLPRLADRLRHDSTYRRRFATVFHDTVTVANVARALASYVRSLRSGNSPVDRYQAGDRGALSGAATRGADLFFGKANCSTCHSGPTLSDEHFHNTGVSSGSDVGRGSVTRRQGDAYAFKVPSLRNVAVTPPYMHDGSLATLESVVEFYDHGGGKSSELGPLRLSEEDKRALVEFLRSLTGTLPR